MNNRIARGICAAACASIIFGSPNSSAVGTEGGNGQSAIGPTKKERKTAPALKQAPVDFNHPPRKYATRTFFGWKVLVEQELLDESPKTARKALDRLRKKLGKVAETLPKDALPDLRRVKLFLLYGTKAKNGGRSYGLEYFRSVDPKHHDWLDPRMANSVVIFSAENYLGTSEFWALKALVHEFGHAHHLIHWREMFPPVYDAWNRAMKNGLYQKVRGEDKGTHVPNYAAQNHLEYFAELTAMYFVGCNYYPRDRASLKKYDPHGFKLVEELWGISAEPR